MTLTFAPVGISAEVLSIEKKYQKIDEGKSGDLVAFQLKDVSHKQLRRGFVASDAIKDPAA